MEYKTTTKLKQSTLWQRLKLTIRWLGGGGGVDFTPSRFFQFFSEMGRAFLQTKFLPVGSSLGHLSMKKFSDLTFHLGSKLRQREDAGRGGGVATTSH